MHTVILETVLGVGQKKQRQWPGISVDFNFSYSAIGRSKGGGSAAGVLPPTGIQFFCLCICFCHKAPDLRLAPPQRLGAPPPPQRKILDPPLIVQTYKCLMQGTAVPHILLVWCRNTSACPKCVFVILFSQSIQFI